MNTTKQKILKQSLMLFNSEGISNVSLRYIATELNISIGNLQYHFKKREDIIETLYFEFVEKISQKIFIKEDQILKSFLNVPVEIINIMFDYHFFFIDFVVIIRNNKKIKTHYLKITKQRKNEFINLINFLIEKKIFRPEELKNEYINLYKRIEILSNFWFSSVLTENKKLTKKSNKQYILLVFQSIYPYLTESAKKEYLTNNKF